MTLDLVLGTKKRNENNRDLDVESRSIFFNVRRIEVSTLKIYDFNSDPLSVRGNKIESSAREGRIIYSRQWVLSLSLSLSDLVQPPLYLTRMLEP